MFGYKLYGLTLEEVENVLRSVYKEITFVKDRVVQIKRIFEVKPISGFEYLKYIQKSRTESNQKEMLFNMYSMKYLIYLIRVFK